MHEQVQLTEDDRKQMFDKLTKKSAILIALCASSLFFVFDYLGDPERGRSAAVVAFVILTCTWMFWNLRGRALFWIAITIVVLCHVPLILLVPWTNKDYPGVVLLPFALPDFAIVFGIFKLVEKAAKRTGRTDDTNTSNENRL
jgi:hypothetical protein